MKKLTFPTQVAAQSMADICHAYLLANNAAYAASVAINQTTTWSIPEQSGTIDIVTGVFTAYVPAEWFIWVNEPLAGADPLIATLFPQPVMI